MNTTHYTLGETVRFPSNINSELAWKVGNLLEGVKMWARNNATGEYVRILEHGPTEWVDGEAQAWSSGNFENLADAKKFGSMAYRFINKGR